MDASNEQAAVVYFGDQPFRFRECTRNRTLDATLNHEGCLGFCPKGADGTRDALICGTCNCHRNYHRRELVVFVPPVMRQGEYKHQPSASRVNLGASSSGAGVSSKKCTRTKFTQGQKDRMLAFAQGLGWRVKKEHEASVRQFCVEIGVEKKVLKVWMHNNKHTLGKMP